MKILQVHNFYQQPGGEDQVYSAEYELLKSRGHAVERYSLHNDSIVEMSGVTAATRTIWNSQAAAEARQLIREFRPDVMHCHNTFPLISPSIYYAAAAEGVPVVQTLHNYRLVCPAATLFREGRVCEECLGRSLPYPAVLHGCYRGGRAASLAVAFLLSVHRAAGTWQHKVKRYIALTEFAKNKLIEGGLPASKIAVKPNFVALDIQPGAGDGGYALYAGRLAEEKGIRTLLSAWERLPDTPLHIVGDGPLRPVVEEHARKFPQITFLGFCDRTQVLEQMRAAACLVICSEWYEGLPMTALESLACGTPLVVSDIGSLGEQHISAVHFPPGDPKRLADAVGHVFADPEPAVLRSCARRNYETNYTPDKNYERLLGIYRESMGSS